jgi:uncharacterized protein (TIGR02001 family)
MNKPLNLLCKTAVTSTLLVALPIQAEGDKPLTFSGMAMLTTDIVDRGISLTNKDPGVLAIFDIKHESGFDVGVVAFNINYLEGETVRPRDRGNIVVGPYVGYRADLSDNLSFDIQVYDWLNPGSASDLNYNFWESTAMLTYSIQDTSLGFIYDFSPEYVFKMGNVNNFEFTVSHSLSNKWSFGGYVGRQYMQKNEVAGSDDFFHYSVWASYPIGDFNVAINYSNTDMDNAEAFNADDIVYFTLIKFF